MFSDMKLVRARRFERRTFRLNAGCSDLLSYTRKGLFGVLDGIRTHVYLGHIQGL